MDRPGELELRRYLRSQRQLAARLLEGETLDEVAADFLFTVANLLRWDAGALWEAGEGEPMLRFVSGWSVADLDAALDALLEADAGLKNTKVSTEDQLLTGLVLALCVRRGV